MMTPADYENLAKWQKELRECIEEGLKNPIPASRKIRIKVAKPNSYRLKLAEQLYALQFGLAYLTGSSHPSAMNKALAVLISREMDRLEKECGKEL